MKAIPVRMATLLAVGSLSSLALTACGSDTNAAGAASGSASTPGSSSSGSAGSGNCGSGTLNAEGSSAQKNAIEEVISAYNETCGDVTINYNPTGSGNGIKQFNAGQVDFAGSDSPLNPDKGEVAAAKKRCAGNDAWNLPMVAGPIAIAYNLDGIDALVLAPEVAAGIFTGSVKTWDDPQIARLNPGAKLPSDPIKVFFRSDESGTTENFTKYLQGAAGKVWTKEPAKIWSGAGEGKEKSAGVAEGVKTTPGSVTYVEWSYAKDNSLGIARIDNGGGPVELTGESAGKAVAAAKPAGSGNDLRLKLDYSTKQAGTYPIVLVTYEVVCSNGLDPAKASLVKGFLTYFAGAEAQGSLEELGYAPLPEHVRSRVETAVKAIT